MIWIETLSKTIHMPAAEKNAAVDAAEELVDYEEEEVAEAEAGKGGQVSILTHLRFESPSRSSTVQSVSTAGMRGYSWEDFY